MWHPVTQSAAPALTPAADRTERRPDPRLAMAGLCLAMLTPSLATSIANVGLPVLAEAFDAPFRAVQWVVLSYLVTLTAVIVIVGRLGDLLGRRRLLLGGIGLFTAASAASALAPSLDLLVAARALQGLGAAVMMALTMAMVSEAVPKEKTGSALGLLGAMSAAGTTLGPSLGGFLIAGLGWPSIFLVNVPLGGLAFVLVLHTVPRPSGDEPAPAAARRFDAIGAGLLAATLVAYALAMTSGAGLAGLLLAGAAVGLGLFVWRQARAPEPLIRLELFRSPALSAGVAASAMVATVMMATLVVGPFYLSRALGLAPVAVGLVLSAGPLVAALAGVPAGRLVDRFGAAPASLAGLGAMAVGLAVLSFAPHLFGVAGYLAPIVVVTGGYALFQTANNTAVMAGADASRRGLVSGLLSLSRNLGLVTGASAMGALFAWASASADVASAAPEAIAAGMRVTFLVAAALVLTALAVTSLGARIAR
jgi:MFS family permease